MDIFLGFITAFPWNWPPYQWTMCHGQLLNIQQYTALFSLVGDTYGGDGRSTFGVPNLQGRQVMGTGTGAGLTPRYIGEMVGYEYITLSDNNLPPHTHTVTASDTTSDSLTQNPAEGWTLGAADSITTDRTPVVTPVHMYGSANPTNPVESAPTSSTGAGAPFPTIPPALCLNFCMALEGIYPSRN